MGCKYVDLQEFQADVFVDYTMLDTNLSRVTKKPHYGFMLHLLLLRKKITDTRYTRKLSRAYAHKKSGNMLKSTYHDRIC